MQADCWVFNEAFLGAFSQNYVDSSNESYLDLFVYKFCILGFCRRTLKYYGPKSDSMVSQSIATSLSQRGIGGPTFNLRCLQLMQARRVRSLMRGLLAERSPSGLLTHDVSYSDNDVSTEPREERGEVLPT